MGIIYSVWGNKGSGKTTTAFKIAKQLEAKGKEVIVVIPDQKCSLDVFVQSVQKDQSIGKVLSEPIIDQDSIIKNLVPVSKKMMLIGYAEYENQYTYPAFTAEAARDFLILIKNLADYVIVDCESDVLSCKLTATALQMSDKVVRLCSCNLKAVAFYKSQLNLLIDRKYKANDHIRVLSNVKEYEPIESIKEYYQSIPYRLDFCEDVEKQMLTGIWEGSKKTRKYDKTISDIVNKLLNQEVKELDGARNKSKFSIKFIKNKKPEVVNE